MRRAVLYSGFVQNQSGKWGDAASSI